MRKTIVLLVCCSLLPLSAFSQQWVRIEGMLIDHTTDDPVENANVRLIDQDSVFVAGGVTDHKGKFELSGIQSGSYQLIISCIGYEPFAILLKDLSKPVKLGTLPIDKQAVGLDEVVVSASQMVTKIDRIVATPTADNIKISSTSVDLLDHLMLPGLRIDGINRTIATGNGGAVELRINGVKVTQNEIESLKPSDVIRVEYIDRPGVRYGGFDPPEAVIDFIVQRAETGFLAMVNLRNAFLTGFGNDMVSFKVNHRKSEFTLSYNISYREYQKQYTDETETYCFSTADTLHRSKSGIPSIFGYKTHDLDLGYSFSDPGRSMFHVAIRNRFFKRHATGADELISSDSPDVYHSKSYQHNKQYLPAIDLYYMRQLKNKQKMEFNLVVNYLKTDYDWSYSEIVRTDTLNRVYTKVDGKQYSMTAEALYNKVFPGLDFTAGVRQWNTWETNDYLSNDQVVKNTRYFTYLYAQAAGATKNQKVNYRLGLAGVRDNGKSYTFYGFRPSLDVKYTLSNTSAIQYVLILSSNSPPVSYINTVKQNIDNLNAKQGNPDLSPYMSYFNTLNYSYTKKKLYANLGLGQAYHRHPIMGYTFYDSSTSQFVSSVKNQDNLQLYSGNFFFKFGPFFNMTTLSVNGQYLHYIVHGDEYTHVMRNFSVGAQLDLIYKDFSFSFRGNTQRKYIWGEAIEFDENTSSARLQYSKAPFTAGLSMLYPLANAWKAGSKSLSAIAPSEKWTYIKDNGRMLVLSFSWNISVGRKFKSASKGLYNEGTWSNILTPD